MPLRRKISSVVKQTQIALFQAPEVPEPFRKAVQAIHMAPQAGPLSLQQAKMFNALLKNAIEQHRQTERHWFEYPIATLMADVGLNSKNRDYVKAVINSLVGFVVYWDHLNGGEPEWNASGLVAAAKLTRSTLSYQFSDHIREFLTNPCIYANIDMRLTRRFRRGYALTLWENIVRYEGVGRTPKIPLQKLRELLLGINAPLGVYAEYKFFKSRILTAAVREINEVSDHQVEMIEWKSGRTVTELQFLVERKAVDAVEHDVDADLLLAVTSLGIPGSETRKLIVEFGEQRVRDAFEYTQGRIAKRHSPAVDNIGAYFRKALEGGWQAAEAKPLAGAQVPFSDKPSAKNKQEELLTRYAAQRAGDARAYFNELDPAGQARYIERYNVQQDAKLLKLVALKKPSRAAETAFFSWLAQATWGEPTDSDLLTFMLNQSA